MEQNKSPKLRTVNKSVSAFPLNEFPKDFPFLLGKELIYLLASKGKPELEGSEWENIFANCIGAEWKPSNVGLDDVVMGNTAWGAKTVKATNPSTQKRVRLISGRNSPVYSFGERIDINANTELNGMLVLDIWNERVSAIRDKFKLGSIGARKLSLIMMDLDRVHEVNDTYGTLAGDKVIVAVAGILKRITRMGDIAARLSGDEYAVLLPDTDGKDAMRVAEHIRQNVMNNPVQVSKSPGSKETVELEVKTSLGIAVAPAHASNERDLVFAADSALRRAKEQGRNRAEIAR